MKTCAVILAGGEGNRLSVLTAKRTKPAVPFGGKFRIIDFVLSNCTNSGLYDVMILAQYRPHSRIDGRCSGPASVVEVGHHRCGRRCFPREIRCSAASHAAAERRHPS